MKASVDGHVVAESNDMVSAHGYQYFPPSAVRMDWLEKTEKTDDDSPVRTASNSTTSSSTASATSAPPGPTKSRSRRWRKVGGRFGFWEDVEVK